jgi:hypothetical protein
MKKKIFALALLSVTLFMNSCSDDDEAVSGRFDRAELYATSNSNGDITVYDFSDDGAVQTTTLTTSSSDHEGIQYNPTTDELFVNSRSNFSLNLYTGIANQVDGLMGAATGGIEGSSDFDSPRALALRGNSIVVADNGDSTFYVYNRTASGVELVNEFDINFPVWGVEFVGNDLYAVVDQSGDVAIFSNFLSNTTDGSLAATKTITIDGINRTHGIAYDATDDVLILTDIGDASSATDGGFHIIGGAIAKINAVPDGGNLTVAGNQIRIAGSNTLLGNPVDVTYDEETETIFIAEKANGGGRILGFDAMASGNVAPVVNNLLPGASSVDFYGED